MSVASSFTCRQDLGVFRPQLPDIISSLVRVSPSQRTQVGKYAVLDQEDDPKFPVSGAYKKVFYCVETILNSPEFTVFLALRSKGDCRRFTKEKRVFTLLKGAKGVIEPLCIQKVGNFEFMITELFNQGDLFDFQKTACGSVRDQIAYSVVCALKECHARGIISRDLKSENIVVRKLADGSFEIKLIDFAYAYILGEDDQHDYSGTLLYISFEDIAERGKNNKFLPASPARDIWALGILLYELATQGYLPVREYPKDSNQLELRPDNGNEIGTFSQEIKDILYKPREQRPSLADLEKRMQMILAKAL